MTTKELAALYGVDLSTAVRWCSAGQVPAYMERGRWRVSKAVARRPEVYHPLARQQQPARYTPRRRKPKLSKPVEFVIRVTTQGRIRSSKGCVYEAVWPDAWLVEPEDLGRLALVTGWREVCSLRIVDVQWLTPRRSYEIR